MNAQGKRQSNVELLRIMAMIGVIVRIILLSLEKF